MVRTIAPATLLADMTEKEWTAQVVELARTLGYRRYHTYRSKNSEAGWPDEALVRERLILAELKRETGKVSDSQRQWLDALASAGQEVYVWFPSDLDEIGKVLGKRWELRPDFSLFNADQR
jgi:hypothetical protein